MKTSRQLLKDNVHTGNNSARLKALLIQEWGRGDKGEWWRVNDISDTL
jgi:hypothetical protein